MTAPAPTPTSPYKIHTVCPPGTVPSLDAALDAFAMRIGTPATPGTPAIPGDPTAVPPIADTPAVPPTPAVPGTLSEDDEKGVAIKTASQEQGYAQRRILKAVFDLIAPSMTPLPPLPEPPAADGSTAPPSPAAMQATFESVP